MQDKNFIEQVGEKIARGQSASPLQTNNTESLSSQQKQDLFNAINQLFAEMELTFHNQYHKAFPSAEKLTYAKKLWFDYLKDYSPERILFACRQATRESDYLPTVHTLLKYCDISDSELGLPDAHQAYIEACQAPSPKTDYTWSHPAVYWAGKASGWFFLANNTEQKALPVFKRNYEIICARIKHGEQLSPPIPTGLPKPHKTALSGKEQRARLKKLREEVNL